ncbi:MAG TPA: hypothetical protein VKY56_00060 [Chloroflexota bacterium]|jgi:hypothetical protein|nr:hypothetical protein [Chloroflexota bacterium]
MAIEHGLPDWRRLRPALLRLQWGDGLTRTEMMNQSRALRTQTMLLLPSRHRFKGAADVLSYFERLERQGRLSLADIEPPRGYPEQSVTIAMVPAPRYPPSIGSGYGSGSTGSSAQTGIGREGTSTHQGWIQGDSS